MGADSFDGHYGAVVMKTSVRANVESHQNYATVMVVQTLLELKRGS